MNILHIEGNRSDLPAITHCNRAEQKVIEKPDLAY